MRLSHAIAAAAALAFAAASPALAQGPAKTPSGSMPNVPSSNSPQSGNSGTGAQIDGGSTSMSQGKATTKKTMRQPKAKARKRTEQM